MKSPRTVPVSPWRCHTLVSVVVVLFTLLVWRVLNLQVLDSDHGYAFLQDQGAARHVRHAEIPAHRGIISDRRGEPLAVSTPVVSIFAHPGKLAASGRVQELADAMRLDSEQLQRKLADYSGKAFMYLQRHMTPRDARRVLALKVDGVSGRREYQRYYPAKGAAAHLVGMTDLDGRGIEGIELAYDRWLQGTPGRKRVIKDLHGEVVRDIGELRPARPGKPLALSIDLRLQYLAERELQRAIATTRAAAGSVVTLDCRTGEVLALVNYPTYNPNDRSDLTAAQMRNRALTDLFEPGSTMKPITLVAALESGAYTPDTVIDTAPGRIQVGSKVLLDPKDYGELSVAQVVAKSSQVGVVKIALSLDEQSVWGTFSRFGLGENPGTAFPGESAGVLPYREQWRPIERATLAYGYGLAVTPLQLARAYAVLANEGLLLQPSLVRLDVAEPARRVVEPGIARQVLDVLHGATSAEGTASSARVPGYSVAGKTGTAHKASEKGYADDRYLAFFAGVAPADRPRLVTVVVIDEPKGDRYYGGEVAAPVFARITKGALLMLNVLPDRLGGEQLLAGGPL